MSECLQVKEFEKIICSKTNVDGYKTISSNAEFEELKKLIFDYAAEGVSADSPDIVKIGYKKNVGEYVTVKNYVGVIELKSGVQIEILPKIDIDDDENSSKTKKIFLNMLRSLKEFSGKTFRKAVVNAERFNLYEIFINMYLEEVSDLVKKGLKSDYFTNDENLYKFKGKLIVKEQIRKNIAHKERFYVEYDEFSLNRPENRLIKATLLKLQKISRENKNVRTIINLLPSFDEVEASKNYDCDFSKITETKSKEYDNLMVWSKIFLYDKSFTTFSGKAVARSILFPMEKVFETYIGKHMKRLFENDYDVSLQDSRFHLFEKPEKFRLRPDIVLTSDEKTIIMDTKWKNLSVEADKNYGISQQDMYQMYAYSKKYGANSSSSPEVWLLYPMNKGLERVDNTLFEDTTTGVKVHIHFIDLENNIDDELNKLRDLL